MSWTSSLLLRCNMVSVGIKGVWQIRTITDFSRNPPIIADFPKAHSLKIWRLWKSLPPFTDFNQEENLDNFLQFRKSDKVYYFGEYLTQGNMNIRGICVETDIQKLIDGGLLKLKPELRDENKLDEWANRVVCPRKSFNASQDIPTAAQTEVFKSITIAEAYFGNE